MQFEILGPLRVSSATSPLRLGAPAQRAVLAVLLTSPNAPISDDRLIDELWGAGPPRSAPHLVHVYVSRLRRVLAEGGGVRIEREGVGYALRVEPEELDADRFLAAASKGRELRDRDPVVADEILAGAMRLWRGAPFSDFPDPPPVVRELAAYLERRRLEALKVWFDVRLQLGRHDELVPELSELVVYHPYDEGLHVQLVLALYRARRQAEALQTARALQERLRAELGVEASAELRTLYRDILLQAPRLSLEPPEPPTNLPARLSSFVGRRRELLEVAELLLASRLLTLTGPGGIGKTRLALEVARRVRAQFPGGVWWIDLRVAPDPASVPDELARTLGVSAPGDPELAEALVRALSRRRALLVLDNCEHVAPAVAETVERILAATTGPHVLATSRTPLGIEHERRWTVPPLSLPPETGSLADMADSDAVRLYVERARAASPSFALEKDNAQAVADVCRRLDGLSLAIEIAAARRSAQTAQEIPWPLDERSAQTELPSVDGLTLHRALEAAMDGSYILLSETERAVFERLSTFVGPFDLDAAAAVGSGELEPSSRALAAVTGLLHASLLTPERDGAEMRYRLLEPLREFGAARLRERGGEGVARRAHADYHLGLAERAGTTLGTPDFAPWEERLVLSYAEICHALTWSLTHQARAVALRAAPALRELWFRRGWAREAERWAERMLDGGLEGAPSGLLAEVHNAACFGADLANDVPRAAAHGDEATRLAREGGATPGLVFALFGRGQIALARGDLEGARRCALEALEACDERNERWGRAGPLAVLGFAALFGGGLAEARAALEEALPLYRELGDRGSLVIMALTPLGIAARGQGDLEAAERYATEAVELGRGTGWEAAGLNSYSEVLSALGDHDAAADVAGGALRVAFETGLENMFRIALRNLACALSERGRYEQAAILAGASRHNMPPYGLDPALYGRLETRCRGALGDGRYEELAARGEAMSHEELVDLDGAGDF